MTRNSYPDNHPTRPSGRGEANRQQENTPQLFGREGEQARLRQLLDAAVGESGGLVLIGGEAGIGKTALATSIAREARGQGIPVCVGHCYEFTATPPYGPWVDSGIFDQRSEDVLSPPMPGIGSGTASSQAALFERMQEFLAGVVRQNPLVLILEDLHWSDPASLELLRFVSRNLHEEERVLHTEGEGWSLEDPGVIRVPTLLRQVIEGRLERLGEETQDLLSIAAVIGQEVQFDLLRSVSGASDDRLADMLGRALEAHLIEQAPDGQRLRFVHALVRETLYGDMLPPLRQTWHRRIGEVLQETSRPDPDEIAHHYRQAGDPRAASWLIQAGLRAEGTYAWMTAAERFEVDLDFLEGDDKWTVRKKGWLLFAVTGEEIVGHAMYVVLGDSSDAEMAIIVEDGWQSRGAGKSLLSALAKRARLRGIETFTAEVLLENRRMLGLAGAMFAGTRYATRDGQYHVRMPLGTSEPAAYTSRLPVASLKDWMIVTSSPRRPPGR